MVRDSTVYELRLFDETLVRFRFGVDNPAKLLEWDRSKESLLPAGVTFSTVSRSGKGEGDMGNILVAHGSPRAGGNSRMLADAFIEGAMSADNETRLIEVGKAKIAGCLACEYCFSHDGRCVQKDDMQRFYPDLHWADTLVYAIPMYCYTWPAQMKAFMDRMFCGIGKPFSIRRAALLLAFEDKDISTAQGLVSCYRISTSYCKWENLGEVLVNGVYEKGAIAGNPGLDEARKLGASLS